MVPIVMRVVVCVYVRVLVLHRSNLSQIILFFPFLSLFFLLYHPLNMFQAPSGVSLSTPARRRPRTNQQQLAILTDFYWNITAYPNRQQLQQLAQQLGFGHDSVNTWLRITHITTWSLYILTCCLC